MARRNRVPLSVVGTYQINLDGQTIACIVKRSARARYIRFEVRLDTGLTVVIPRFYNIGQIHSLLETKRRWILSKLANCVQSPTLTNHRELKESDIIPYLGRELELRIQQNQKGADSVGIDGDKLVVTLTNQNGKLKWMLEQWYRRQAAEIIQEKVDKLSARFGLTYNRICIRAQRTRWGSCSYSGNLNFNWKLIMAPEPVVDYVVIHELMHLEEMNHTNRFWKLVAEKCPDWRELKKWLREHEAELATKLAA